MKWTPEEDLLLIKGVSKCGTKDWTSISKFVPDRSPKQCRERWTGQLDPSVNKAVWTLEEESLLMNLHILYGNQWSKIASMMPGRSANCVKNRHKLIMKKGFMSSSASTPPEPEHINKGSDGIQTEIRINNEKLNLDFFPEIPDSIGFVDAEDFAFDLF